MPDIVTITTTNDVVAGSTTTDVVSVGYSLPASAVPALTESATVYVTTDGRDSNDGLSWKTAFATVQHAINSLPTVNGMQTGIVEVGAGTFTSSSTITVAANQAPWIRGRGTGQTTTFDITPVHATELHYTGSSDALQVNGPPSLSGATLVPMHMLITDLAVTGTASARYGISVSETERFQMHNVAIDKFGTFGFYIIDVYWIELDWVTITQCGTAGSASPTGGANLATGGGGHQVNLALVTNSIFLQNIGYGVYAVSPDTVTFVTCDFSDTTANAQAGSGTGVVCNGVGPFKFIGCWYEGNAGVNADGNSEGAVCVSFDNCYFATSQYGIANFGNAAITACTFQGHTSGYSILDNQGFPLTWSSCYSTDSTGFISGFSGGGYSTGGHWPTAVASQRGQIYSSNTGGWGAQSGLSGAITIQTFRGNVLNLFLSGNVTSSAFDISPMGQVVTVAWVQDSSGSRSYAWPANCKFAGGAAPAASTTANYRDAVTFYCDGTNWYEISRSAGIH